LPKTWKSSFPWRHSFWGPAYPIWRRMLSGKRRREKDLKPKRAPWEKCSHPVVSPENQRKESMPRVFKGRCISIFAVEILRRPATFCAMKDWVTPINSDASSVPIASDFDLPLLSMPALRRLAADESVFEWSGRHPSPAWRGIRGATCWDTPILSATVFKLPWIKCSRQRWRWTFPLVVFGRLEVLMSTTAYTRRSCSCETLWRMAPITASASSFLMYRRSTSCTTTSRSSSPPSTANATPLPGRKASWLFSTVLSIS